MYRKGHYGVSLLVFAPIALVLLAVDRADLAVVTGGVMLWLAMLPDIDHRLPLIPHRGPTHSLVFAALVGGIFAGVGAVLEIVGGGDAWSIVGLSLPVVGFATGALAILAHLLGDALTPAGVNFLWPVSTQTYTIGLCRADNTIANYGLFAAGVFATGVAVYLSVTL